MLTQAITADDTGAPLNIPLPDVFSPVPSVTDVKLEHDWKAPIPILSTESGIVTDVKLVH